MLSLLALGVVLAGPVPEAIERSVQERMGDVRVVVTEINDSRIAGPESRIASPGLMAIPEPGSRLGRTMRFVLVDGSTRVGSVVAKLSVTGRAVRASRALSRDEEVGADGAEAVDVELKDMLLRRLPTLEEIVGTHARRDIAAGEVLTEAVVIVPPTVQSGDEVRVSVTAGPVEVTGVGRASGTGRVRDVIRVLVPSSRTPLKARITGPGSVEIVR